jgi:hypothetical protein
MKRFRLSTLILLVVIAALCVASVVLQDRASRREAELQAQVDMQNARSSVKKSTRPPAPSIPSAKQPYSRRRQITSDDLFPTTSSRLQPLNWISAQHLIRQC